MRVWNTDESEWIVGGGYFGIAEPLLVLYKLRLKNASVLEKVANALPVFKRTLDKMWKIPDW